MDKKLILIIVGVAIGLFLIISYSNGTLLRIASYLFKPAVDTTGIVLFYGDTCSHCKNVEDFIVKNKVEEKVEFTRLEVFNNQSNAKILANKAKICKIDTTQIGVPFLWDGKTCIIGDVDIIKFFQDKIK